MYTDHIRRDAGRDLFRGHLPPPFYSGLEDTPRRLYLSEPGLREPIDPNKIYGNAVNKFPELSGTSGSGAIAERYDPDYRHYGDRRWPDDAQSAWEKEYDSRRGYRSINERVEIGRNYRGKGPRSYQRPDHRILDDLNERLSEDAFLDASDIETSVSSAEVILSGTVPDRESKRRAEDIAETISGVRNVENRLRVK